MSNSTVLLERVRELKASGADLDERPDTLILRGALPNAAAQADWIGLAATPPEGLAVQIYDPEIAGDLTPGEPFDPARTFSVAVAKPIIPRVVCFFFESEATKAIGDRIEIASALRILDLDPMAAFQARGLDVDVWDLDGQLAPPAAPTPIDPSKLVADYVPERAVPRDLSPWLLQRPPARGSRFYEAWRATAAARLLSGLVSSATREAGVVWLQASGPPLFKVRADDPTIAAAWLKLSDAAEWVYLSGFDIEARYRLFSAELARAARPNLTLIDQAAQALEAAKVAYDAHVQSSSRETLKALADLRKTVIDETQKVTQRTQDMTSGLARDLAVTAAPFVLKILADAGRVEASAIAAAFYFGAALFLAVSFGLQWRINKAYLRGQKASRTRWMQTLYSYISPKERDEISEQPVRQAIANYRETRAALLVIYVMLIAALLGTGVHTLSAPPASASASNAVGTHQAPATAQLAKSARQPSLDRAHSGGSSAPASSPP